LIGLNVMLVPFHAKKKVKINTLLSLVIFFLSKLQGKLLEDKPIRSQFSPECKHYELYTPTVDHPWLWISVLCTR